MKIKTFLFALLCLSGTVLMSGCETMKGVGRDVENAGDSIEDAAD